MQNQGNNPANQLIGGLINNVVGTALNNTDVQLGFENGNLQVAVLPKQPGGQDDGETCVPNGQGRPSVGIRAGPGLQGDCDCWDRGVDYSGADLPISNNPAQVTGAQECQKLCQATENCSHWSWERKRRRRTGRRTSQCWLKSSGFRRRDNRERISGPRNCGQIEITQPSQASTRPTAGCTTNGGGDSGARCVFPFTYKGRTYRGCILVDADDNIPWCSTLTDNTGQHVGGQGKWGHCPATCNKDTAGTPATVSTTQATPTDASVSVEGSLSNTKLSQLPWFPSDGKLSLPIGTVANNNIEGVTQNDITNRFLALGLNRPNIGHGSCRAPGNGQGSCRHIHHCVKPVYFNFFTFLTHMCIIEGRLGQFERESTNSYLSQYQVYWGLLSRRCDNHHHHHNHNNCTYSSSYIPIPQQRYLHTKKLHIYSTKFSVLECGVNAKRFQTRIVGGRPADPDEWPWLAALVSILNDLTMNISDTLPPRFTRMVEDQGSIVGQLLYLTPMCSQRLTAWHRKHLMSCYTLLCTNTIIFTGSRKRISLSSWGNMTLKLRGRQGTRHSRS